MYVSIVKYYRTHNHISVCMYVREVTLKAISAICCKNNDKLI